MCGSHFSIDPAFCRIRFLVRTSLCRVGGRPFSISRNDSSNEDLRILFDNLVGTVAECMY